VGAAIDTMRPLLEMTATDPSPGILTGATVFPPFLLQQQNQLRNSLLYGRNDQSDDPAQTRIGQVQASEDASLKQIRAVLGHEFSNVKSAVKKDWEHHVSDEKIEQLPILLHHIRLEGLRSAAVLS